jgi:hypothetical protein
MIQQRGNTTRSTGPHRAGQARSGHAGMVRVLGVLLVLVAIASLVTAALAHRPRETPARLSPWINELGQVAQIMLSRTVTALLTDGRDNARP